MSAAVKGYLDPVILAVLASGALHGYAVIEELKARSGGELDLLKGRCTRHSTDSSGVAFSGARGRQLKDAAVAFTA